MTAGGIRVVQNSGVEEAHNDSKSMGSYRSTHTTRSSVLERAREYNRRIDEQKQRRSKSLERQTEQSETSAMSGTPRSQSAGRIPNGQQGQGSRLSTRERAMASVQRESNTNKGSFGSVDPSPSHSTNSYSNHSTSHLNASPVSMEQPPAPTPRSNGSPYSSHLSRPKPTTPRMAGSYNNGNTHVSSPNASTPRQSTVDGAHRRRDNESSADRTMESNRSSTAPQESPSRSMKSSQKVEENHEAVVTPELLVDALSGHEDGLLAIAERLMEHYDSGYDVMGEAIIDAFADVQKLFQHVVEAAHMEGAAFEASRKEEEISELRKQISTTGVLMNGAPADGLQTPASPSNGNNGPTRHDEFIDQDVKDVLTEAIRKGATYRDNNKFSECYELYERSCHSASALLPVDSDHRGRLQLSIARAESMSHERACAILRYAMDDVLRSGLRAGGVPLPDPSQRADVVLNRPKGHPHITGATGQVGVGQSSEEALNSLVEEMREVMSAPVYNNTPLQSVAKRFLAALADAQKQQQKNEEKLEQNLAKLKGDFLLARAEWEEKLNSSQETSEMYKEKYQKLKESTSRSVTASSGESYLDHARSALASQQQRINTNSEEDDTFGGFQSIRSSASKAGSHASLGSGLANHARSIVGSFSCTGSNNIARTSGVGAQELAENRDAEIREMAFRHDSGMRDRRRATNNEKRNVGGNQNIKMTYSDRSYSTDTQSQQSGGYQRRTPHSVASGSTRSKSSRSFREYSRSPQRVDF